MKLLEKGGYTYLNVNTFFEFVGSQLESCSDEFFCKNTCQDRVVYQILYQFPLFSCCLEVAAVAIESALFTATVVKTIRKTVSTIRTMTEEESLYSTSTPFASVRWVSAHL